MTDVMTKPHQLIANDRIEGTAVRRPNGDRIGHIERLMIDKISGKVSYELRRAPSFRADKDFDWGDRSQEAELHRYYGIAPCWGGF